MEGELELDGMPLGWALALDSFEGLPEDCVIVYP
jgi:hypothetical protein